MAFEYAIALTGSISTGKSTVSKILASYGFTVIDADTIAHQMLDEQHQKIGEMFGTNIVHNKKVDRKTLGAIVFADVSKRKKLEALLHPLIFDRIKQLSKEEDRLKKPYLIDIPLFFENGRYPIEKSLVVYANKEAQLERLMQRDGYSKKEALSRIETQMDIEEKRKRATYVIDNSGDLNHLQNECKKIKEIITGEFT
jgi:dephospho-CoA kinase